jgi:hypothetical protein
MDMALPLPGRVLLILAALSLLALGWVAIVNVPLGLRGSNHAVPPQVALPNPGRGSAPAVETAPAVQAPAPPVQEPAATGTGTGSVGSSVPPNPPDTALAAQQTAPPAAPAPGQGSDHCGGAAPPMGAVKRPPVVACQAT